MDTNTSHTDRPGQSPVRRAGYVLLVVGGVAFFVGGPMHPAGTDQGDKTEQLHSMLVDSAWYPAHLVALLGFAGVAAGLLALRHDPRLREGLGRLLPVSVVVAVAAVVGAVIHLLAATQADELEENGATPLVLAFTGVETIVNPVWGLMIAALAVVGGLDRCLGNRVVLPLGLLGGLAFAVASATIAFVDTFDALFPVAGLAGIWLVAVGVIGLARRSSPQSAPEPARPEAGVR